MANSFSKAGITTGNTVEAWHVTQSIDAFSGLEAYDVSLSGSLNMTGSITGEPGVINDLTASYAISASYAPFPTLEYVTYRATLTQTGTNAPTPTVLESSSLFAASSFVYGSTGVFYFSSSGAFPTASKVEVEIDNMQVLGYTMTNNTFNVISAAVNNTDLIEIRTGKVTYQPMSGSNNALTVGAGTGAITDLLSNDVLNNTRFVIKVWS
jgi:hypothetical protein